MKKNKFHIINKLFSDRENILEFIIISIFLAIALDIISGNLQSIFKLNDKWVFYSSIVFVMLTFAYFLRRIFGKLQNKISLLGFTIVDSETNEVIKVPRYDFSVDLNLLIREITRQFDPVRKVWNSSKTEHSQIITEATSYYVLTEISTHLQNYFNKQNLAKNKLEHYDSDKLSEIAVNNRFLYLFSIPYNQHKKNGTEYKEVDLVLPKGTTIKCNNNSSFSIVTRRVVMNFSVECVYDESSKHFKEDLNLLYLDNREIENLDYYNITLRIEIKFKKISVLTKSGWDYYNWLDSFIPFLSQNFSKAEFLEQIGWGNMRTLIEGFEKYSNSKERIIREKIEAIKNDRTKYLSNSRISKWLISYYDQTSSNQGKENPLPIINFFGETVRIPFLTNSNWNPNSKDEVPEITIEQDNILKFDETFVDGFNINHELIEERRLIGQKLWDAPTVFLDYISGSMRSNDFKIHAKTCRYFASLTNMLVFEYETLNAIKNNNFLACPLRKDYYTNTNNIGGKLYRPLTIGCMAQIAIRSEDGYLIILQTRSKENSTDNDVVETVPSFGLSPFIGKYSPHRSLLYYNFLVEYLEELHGIEDLDNPFSKPMNTENYYDHIYEHPEVKALHEANFKLYFLGFGFTLSNGFPTIGMLGVIDDVEFGQYLRKKISPSWEIGGKDPLDFSINPIEFVNLNDRKRWRELDDRIGPPAKYFINKAQVVLNIQ